VKDFSFFFLAESKGADPSKFFFPHRYRLVVALLFPGAGEKFSPSTVLSTRQAASLQPKVFGSFLARRNNGLTVFFFSFPPPLEGFVVFPLTKG